MVFSKTIKYFKSIRVYVYCDICKDIIEIEINKEDIRKGVKTGTYLFKFQHKNENPDPDDPSDESWQEHTCAVYIDKTYEVKIKKCYFGEEMSVSAMEGDRIPVSVRKIPSASVRIGMVTTEQYKILQLCTGSNTILEISEIAGVSLDDLNLMMDKLREKGLINIIIRT